MANVGYATMTILPDAKGFGPALGGAIQGPLGSSGKKGGKALGGGILGSAKGALGPLAGVMAGVFATTAIVGWGKAQVAALGNIERINAQTTAVITSTGGAAGVTTEHIEKLAGSLEDLTGTEAESTQEGANLLLTFKNIANGVGEGNDVFDQATSALVDMSRAMGTDPQSSAIQLGKALNDPIAGIAALSRVGVQFTDDQKGLIESLVESGDVMGAQKIILGELNAQFGGSGAAYAATYAGKVELLGHAWGTFGEQVFSVAMPAIGGIAGALTGLLNNTLTPGVVTLQNGAKAIFAAFRGDKADLSGISGPLAGIVGTITAVVGTITAAVAPMMPALMGVFGALGPQVLALLPMLSPVGLIFQALLPVLPQVATLVAALAVHLGGMLTQGLALVTPVLGLLVDLLSGVFVAVLPIISGMLVTLSSSFGPIRVAIMGVLSAVLPLVASLLTALMPVILNLVTTVLPVAAQVFGMLVGAIAPLVTMLASLLIPIIKALMPVVIVVFGIVVDVITAAMQIVQGIIQVVTGIISGDWGAVWDGIKNIFAGVWDGIVALLKGAVALIGSLIMAGLAIVSSLWTRAWSSISSFLSGIWTSIISGLGVGIATAITFFSGLPGRLLGALGNLGGILYSAGSNIINGLMDGIRAVAGGIAEAILGPIRNAVNGVKAFLGIKSPSRLFKEIGAFTGEGMALGLESKADRVASASDSLIPTVPSFSAPSVEGGAFGRGGGDGTPAAAAFANYGVIQVTDEAALVAEVEKRQRRNNAVAGIERLVAT